MEVKWAGPQGHALETRIRSLRSVRNDSSAVRKNFREDKRFPFVFFAIIIITDSITAFH